ncbi:Structural maintenance of chromosomes protein 4 [Savitreella phatthalungensis]
MSARPARRATARSRIIESSGSEGEDDVSQLMTPAPRASNRTRRGSASSRNSSSKAGQDHDYTPASAAKRAESHPRLSRSVSATKTSSAGRKPLAEVSTQSRLPLVESKEKKQDKENTSPLRVPSEFERQDEQPEEGRKSVLPPAKVGPARIDLETVNTADLANDYHDASASATGLEQAPKTRIVISKLVLENFKSYAGVQRIGPFHKSFSAVVGPNGSGKSNVIDSLLFVFGFRASKMRQGKISALIHNSATNPDLTYCQVEVHFETIHESADPADYRVVPDSQIIVARRAYKNNSSRYTINGRESSFTEVTTLLRERGIDLDHKRFLILQGEVESIAQMKPKAANEHEDGLLEYLEDIIGTSKYKLPIEGALQRTEALNEICQEKISRVQIVEKERSRLEDRKDVAVRQICQENELVLKQSSLWQLYHHETTRDAAATREVIAELEAERKSLGDNDELLRTLELKHRQAIRQHDELKAVLDRHLEASALAEKANVQIQEKVKHLAAKQKKLAKANATAQQGIRESNATIHDAEREIQAVSKEIVELEARLEVEDGELSQIRNALKHKTQAFTDGIEAKQKQKRPWDKQIAAKKSELEVVKAEVGLLEDAARGASDGLERARSELEELQQEQKNKLRAQQDNTGRVAEVTRQLKTLEVQIGEVRQAESSAKSEYTTARQRADEARASLSAVQSQGAVLSGLGRLRDAGRIDGFHGRLGDLGRIDEMYDVAISTACPQLDNIVVETVETGQQCIEHLRKNNLGRAMFILLDRLPNRDLSRVDTPENAPRLFDLVEPREPRFAPAFYSVLQNTLVARDLDQANRLAYGKTRWRVVTLDGQLIDKSGAMTGGGQKVAKGGMSSKFAANGVESQASVTKLEQARDRSEKVFDDVRAKMADLEAEHVSLQQELPRLHLSARKLVLELETLDSQRTDLTASIDEMQRAAGDGSLDAQDKKRSLQQRISSLEADIFKLQNETADLDQEIQSLQEQILEVGGIKLRTQSSKCSSLKEQIALLQDRLDKVQFSKLRAGKDLTRVSKQLETGEAEHQSVEQELSALQELADSDMKSSRRNPVNKDVTQAEEAVDRSAEDIKAIKKELDTEQKAAQGVRAKGLELKNRLEEHNKRLGDSERKAIHWREKLMTLVLQPLPSYLTEHTERTPGSDEGTDSEDEDETGAFDAAEQISDLGESLVDEEDSHGNSATPVKTIRRRPAHQNRLAGPDPQHSARTESSELHELSPDELESLNRDSLKRDIEKLEKACDAQKVDLSVLEEYRRRCEELSERQGSLDEAIRERDSARSQADDLRRRRLTEFMRGFAQISQRLKEMYQMITMGGNAELELVDSLDPFSEGILFSVMPPRKSWKNISNLSGGEKTLSSLALVFALHHYKPTPLYVMDEIDAALDFRNVSIVANYIRDRTKNAQFIVISLRNNMFELAARLVGIYKTRDMTKSIAIDNRDILGESSSA